MSTDPIAAIEARLRELDEQIAGIEATLSPLVAERERWERALGEARGLASGGHLTGNDQRGNSEGMPRYAVSPMGKQQQSERAKMSTRSSRFLREYAWPAGISSLRDLAERMRADAKKRGGATEDAKITHSHLSQALNDGYPMSPERAERIREKTRSQAHPEGYEATVANWPGLRLPVAD